MNQTLISRTKKSITLSDAHIKKRSWVSRPQIKEDAYLAVAQVVDYCLKESASLKIAGDLFDVRTPESRDVKFFMDQMDRMEVANLPVFAIQGNHDKTNDVPWFVLHNWVQWVEQEIFEPIMGFPMYALDYRTRTELEEALASIPPGVSGIMLHQGCKSILPFENAWDLDEELLPDNIKYVDLGHIHHTQIWDVHGHKCSYPGSPYVTDIDHDPDKYVFMQELVDGEIEITPLLLKTRGFVEVIINETDTYEQQLQDALKSVETLEYVDHSLEPVLYIKYNTLLEGEIHAITERVLDTSTKFYPWYAPCKPEQLVAKKEIVVVEDASVDDMARDEAETPELAELVLELLKGSVATTLEGVRDRIFNED